MLKIEIFDEKTGIPATDNSNRMLNALITYAFKVSYEETQHPKMSRNAKRGYKHSLGLAFANSFITNMVGNARRILEMADLKED